MIVVFGIRRGRCTIAPSMNDFVPDQFWREEVERARKQTPEEKFRMGGELFDAACEVTLAGIRAQYPGITPERALEVLRMRLDLSRRIEGTI